MTERVNVDKAEVDEVSAPCGDQELGYRFDPDGPPDHPAARRLIVTMHAAPTGRHYDPESMQADVVDADGGLARLTLSHPWQGAEVYQACAGRVILRDRKDKPVEAFTFGGELAVAADEERTVCILQSPAPILALLWPYSVSWLLADEAAILLAERRAAWDMAGRPAAGFDQRLAAAEPLELYMACLAAMEEKLAQGGPEMHHSLLHQIARFIRTEIARLEEAHVWPAYDPHLAELL